MKLEYHKSLKAYVKTQEAPMKLEYHKSLKAYAKLISAACDHDALAFRRGPLKPVATKTLWVSESRTVLLLTGNELFITLSKGGSA